MLLFFFKLLILALKLSNLVCPKVWLRMMFNFRIADSWLFRIADTINIFEIFINLWYLSRLIAKVKLNKRGLCTSESMKNQAPSCGESRFFCFKYRQMSFKEELRRKKLSSPLIFLKKIIFYLNRIDIHVIYVKKFLTKVDVWGYTWIKLLEFVRLI